MVQKLTKNTEGNRTEMLAISFPLTHITFEPTCIVTGES